MQHDHPRRSRLARVLVGVLLTGATGVLAYAAAFQQLASSALPVPRPISTLRAVADTRGIDVTVTRDWKKVRFESFADEVTSSPAIWMEMHFGDWDQLPADVRRRGLLRLRQRFESAVSGPAAWALMDAADWDAIPQPIRMVVFPLMIEHWVEAYELGSVFNLPSRLMADTVSAIVMAESWFQHRADVINEWGNRDIGLGQCSNRCRKDLARMAEAGLVDFAVSDEDYLNPWHATRTAVVWFGLELARAEGDVDLAIRAYHRGYVAASRGEGEEYLHNVRRLRAKYFDPSTGRSPTWQRLTSWARPLAKEPRWQPTPSPVRAHYAAASPADEQPRIVLERQLAETASEELVADGHDQTSHSGVGGGRTR